MPTPNTSNTHDIPESEAPNPGLSDDLKAFLTSMGRYAKARAHLFKLEAAEAGEDFARRAVMLIVGAFLLLIAYLLLIAGIIGFAELHKPGSWPVATLILAGVHLILGLPLLIIAKRSKGTAYFSESLQQCKLDQQWINSPEISPPKQIRKP